MATSFWIFFFLPVAVVLPKENRRAMQSDAIHSFRLFSFSFLFIFISHFLLLLTEDENLITDVIFVSGVKAFRILSAILVASCLFESKETLVITV